MIKRLCKTKEWLFELVPNNKSALTSIFESLQYKNYKLYFYGQIISLTGTSMQQVAMSWLVYRMTGSIMLLGTVAFLTQIPSLFVSPLMGVVNDRFDRKKILIFTQVLSMTQALLLATLVLTNTIQIVHILILSIFLGLINSLDAPVRQAFYTKLVPTNVLGNAIALNSATFNCTKLIGPTIGGILIAMVGEGICFLINSVSFIGVIFALMQINTDKPMTSAAKGNLWHEMKEGFIYSIGFLPIRSILIFIVILAVLSFPFPMMLPAFVKSELHGGSDLYGYFIAATGIGSLISTLYLAARKSVLGLAKIVMFACGIQGISLIAFSLTHIVWLLMIICFFIGFSYIACLASCNTLIQSLTDEDKRGRVMSYYTMAFLGFTPIGNLLQGYAAEKIGLSTIYLICGILVVLTAIAFGYYRPAIRKASRPIYVQKGIITEIAYGLQSSKN
ncbi:MAG: transporter [Bacteroidetes bacterium]|nr:transporter [Bacteroidota bacterium]